MSSNRSPLSDRFPSEKNGFGELSDDKSEGEEMVQIQSPRSRSLSEQRVIRGMAFARYYWLWHFGITIALIAASMIYNGGNQKYAKAKNLVDCESKQYVNVWATSEDSPSAVICCDDTPESALCPHTKPPLSKQLITLPGALLIPLVPFFVGVVTVHWEVLFMNGLMTERWYTTLWRLLFYVLIMLFRGFVLYKGVTELQNRFVEEPESCWYQTYTGSCDTFDYSDHTVLYLGQILAIPLFELLHLFTTHHWSRAWKGAFTFIAVFMIYLYIITLWGQFKTGAYYHTPLEIFIGYLISLVIQVPLACFQSTASLIWLRETIFGHTTTSSSVSS